MTDETSRSAPGNPRDQRHNQDAPAWWRELGRADLPDDGGTRPRRGAARATRPTHTVVLRTSPHPAPRTDRRADRHRTGLLTVLAVVIAAVVAWIGIGGGSIRSVVVVLIIFGVPTAVAAVAATVVLKRGS